MTTQPTQSALRRCRRRLALSAARLHRQVDGATTLEWTLLLAAIALPSYFIMRLALEALIGHYQMVTTVNSLPFP